MTLRQMLKNVCFSQIFENLGKINLYHEDFLRFVDTFKKLENPTTEEKSLKDSMIVVESRTVAKEKISVLYAWIKNEGRFIKNPATYLDYEVVCKENVGIEAQLGAILLSMIAEEDPFIYIYGLMVESLCDDQDGSKDEIELDAKTVEQYNIEWDQCWKSGKKIVADQTIRQVVFASEQAIEAIQTIEWLVNKFPNAASYTVKDSKKYFSVDGCICEKWESTKTLWAVPPAKGGDFVVPDGITMIGSFAFYKSTLSSVKFPETLRRIDEIAFCECDKIEQIFIPANVKCLGDQGLENPFVSCENLREILVDPENKNYFDQDGVLYSSQWELLCYPSGKQGDFTLPEECACIGWCAFSDCAALQVLTVSKKLRLICDEAFYNCKHLLLKTGGNAVAERYAQEQEMDYIS